MQLFCLSQLICLQISLFADKKRAWLQGTVGQRVDTQLILSRRYGVGSPLSFDSLKNSHR